ncbi:acetyltransferase family protein [Clostridium argentinense CDC 2741]|uniref:Acetyltransferase family protein n=1 Tax=Clostridium argentinense CDC 2741 TaxID=1418104 RepID=A0A0C1UGT0_9CLOT|nr:GNAT family protein [Clostridium argentinense]ARC86365.1 N-acetyltransferase [Clostridium argentinense]KIE46610.1 acetyltransferase family protein [Clostridium argentinense CDC 2741]NFF41385.1 GNAT family N-acetyltransferase [Clostridium argentinense]NFP49945.1 GNAT family N-acetyltransferase [Clostridium argentinense]NFP71215.1 GNAT family N-acetyltransferase [Clostridium argentinense]
MLLHKGTEAISTDRLLLRRFELNDAYDMFKNWANDSEITKFLSWKPHSSVEDTKEILGQWVNEYKDNNIYNWVIELKEIGEVIGSICIVKLDEKNYSCEVGYCISRMYWNKGIMSESLKAVIDYLFSEIEFNRIAAKHDTNNVASGKVMLKSGMKYEGTLRQVEIRDNKEFYDLAVYAILKNDWLIKDKQSS